MKRCVVGAILLVVLSLSGCTLFESVDVSGTWEGRIEYPAWGRSAVLMLYLVQSGTAISGEVVEIVPAFEKRFEIRTGLLEDDRVYIYAVHGSTGLFDYEEVHTLRGMVTADCIRGSVDEGTGKGEGTWYVEMR